MWQKRSSLGKNLNPNFPELNPGSSRVLDLPFGALPEFEVPFGGELLPDTNIWINRFTVPSDSTNAEYIIAQHRTKRFWACSCRGFTSHQKCKHLGRLGLPIKMEPHEARVAITAESLPKVLTVERADKNAVTKPRRRFALPEEDV
jgi:hypothetical protein